MTSFLCLSYLHLFIHEDYMPAIPFINVIGLLNLSINQVNNSVFLYHMIVLFNLMKALQKQDV